MIINTKANIYVSIGQQPRRDSDESLAYRREKHTFMISVEPRHVHIPGTPRHDAALTHFEAIKDVATSNYGIAKYSSKKSHGVIGNVLIAESAHVSTDKVHKILSEKLAMATKALEDGDSYADNEDEHWIRAFVHALQDREAVANFRLDEFITWLHGFLADRVNDQAPTLVTYPRAHMDHDRGPSKGGSQIRQPLAKKTRTNSRGGSSSPGGWV